MILNRFGRPLLAALVLIVCVALVGSAQLQQSGGPGSTVTANIGTTNGLALDATLTSGSQKTKLVDSAGRNSRRAARGFGSAGGSDSARIAQ